MDYEVYEKKTKWNIKHQEDIKNSLGWIEKIYNFQLIYARIPQKLLT